MASDKPPVDPDFYTHKEFGAAFFDVTLPNSYERMWMVMRAINFESDKYNRVYNVADKALKRRYLRNFFRLVDNPIGYVFWHSRPYFESGAIKLMPMFWAFSFFATFWYMGSA